MLRTLFAGALLLCAGVVSAAEKPTLVLYNWSEYLPKKVLRQFTKGNRHSGALLNL